MGRAVWARSARDDSVTRRRERPEPDRPLTPERFRLVVFGRPRGPWRDTRDAVVLDAVREGLAAWDASRREHYVPVPADIERQSFGDRRH